ncbi:MAG: COG1470 family protein [Actinomycetota bacterium]
MRKMTIVAATLSILGLSMMGFFTGSAGAAAGLQLTTPYPAVLVESGKSVSLAVQVITPAPRRVDLSVIEAPPGWQATLNGGGYTINSVFGAPDDPPSIQLNVKVPPGVAKGNYRVLVKGSSAGVQDILETNFTVAEVAQGAVTLVAEFPSRRGEPSGTFNYKLTLTNNSPESTTFNLSGTAPTGVKGWEVTVYPASENQATTVKVDGGATAEITAEVNPPDNATAGKYPIQIMAEAGAKKADATVETEITGTSKLTLTTPNGRLNADGVAGKPGELQMVVRNEGTSPAQDVKLQSSPPTGWKVTFKPSAIPAIPAGGSRPVKAIITPSGDAVAGDYNLTLTANAGGSSDAEVRYTVETSKLFGLLGLAVIGGAIYFLLRVFGIYGRR